MDMSTSETGEVAQWVKCLLQKPEVLSLDPQWIHICNLSAVRQR